MEIEYLRPDKVKPYANNAKRHPADQIEQIKKSIQEFGFNDPVAVYEDGEIAEGHGRIIAATELGLEEVPVVRITGLSEDQKKAYRIVHNQLTMNSGLDEDLLQVELSELEDMGLDEYGLKQMEIDAGQYEEFFEESDHTKKPKVMKCPFCGGDIEL